MGLCLLYCRLLLERISCIPSVVDRREAGSGRLASDGGDLDEEDEWASESNSEARAWSLSDGPFKLVLIVNMELKMGKGKVREGGGVYGIQMPCPAQINIPRPCCRLIQYW